VVPVTRGRGRLWPPARMGPPRLLQAWPGSADARCRVGGDGQASTASAHPSPAARAGPGLSGQRPLTRPPQVSGLCLPCGLLAYTQDPHDAGGLGQTVLGAGPPSAASPRLQPQFPWLDPFPSHHRAVMPQCQHSPVERGRLGSRTGTWAASPESHPQWTSWLLRFGNRKIIRWPPLLSLLCPGPAVTSPPWGLCPLPGQRPSAPPTPVPVPTVQAATQPHP
jgi:hypothetical protein